jgi:hypothetical protein
MKKPNGITKQKWDSMTVVGQHLFIMAIKRTGSLEGMRAEGRLHQAKAVHASVLSKEDVEDIRSGGTNSELAAKYNVSESYISKIRNHRRK